LIGYWLAMTHGTHQLTIEDNLATYIDRLIIPAKHLYLKHFEPEGLLSTLPAIATALLGNLLGTWLLTQKPQQKLLYGIIIAGLILCGLGWLWHSIFPINKTLWSSSYVLWTGGLAYLVYGGLYWLVEIKQHHRWLKPLEQLGQSAMTVFVLHVLFLKLQAKISFTQTSGTPISLRAYLTQLFPTESLYYASLYYAFASVCVWFLVIYIKQHFQN